jgi:hypothetical protein
MELAFKKKTFGFSQEYKKNKIVAVTNSPPTWRLKQYDNYT